MRIGIISDIHGNLVALEAVLADLRPRGTDFTINLGDCVTGPLWPRETIELLDTLSLQTVRGNHDRYLIEKEKEDAPMIAFTRSQLTDEQRSALGNLPDKLELSGGILAVHGTLESDTDYLLEDLVEGRLALATSATLGERLSSISAGLVLCGHSHNQHMAQVRGSVVVLNPGSVGEPRYAGNPYPHVAEAGSPHARYAIATARGEKWQCEMHAVPYDWEPVVMRAGESGFELWANGFLRGEKGTTFTRASI